jgi:hypothetical protein
MSRMDIGGPDECGRCGKHRSGGPHKDVTVHTTQAETGNWYLCEGCIAKLDTVLMNLRRGTAEE